MKKQTISICIAAILFGGTKAHASYDPCSDATGQAMRDEIAQKRAEQHQDYRESMDFVRNNTTEIEPDRIRECIIGAFSEGVGVSINMPRVPSLSAIFSIIIDHFASAACTKLEETTSSVNWPDMLDDEDWNPLDDEDWEPMPPDSTTDDDDVNTIPPGGSGGDSNISLQGTELDWNEPMDSDATIYQIGNHNVVSFPFTPTSSGGGLFSSYDQTTGTIQNITATHWVSRSPGGPAAPATDEHSCVSTGYESRNIRVYTPDVQAFASPPLHCQVNTGERYYFNIKASGEDYMYGADTCPGDFCTVQAVWHPYQY